jgi:Uma2 family endonuclease
MPEPDLAVVPPGDHDRAHPECALLVVEVADSSLQHDRAAKGPLYAGMGVPEYWIVNLVDERVEVHTDIVRGTYSRVVPYRRGEQIGTAVLAGAPVEVATVLGEAPGA